LSDNYSRILNAVRIFSETAKLSDEKIKEIYRGISEAIALTDEKEKIWNLSREYSESLDLSSDEYFSLLRELSDTLSLSDGDAILNYVKLLTESMGLSEIFYKEISKLPNDFFTGPLSDLGETVTRTSVTKGTDFHGNRTYTDGEESEIQVVFINPEQRFTLDKAGLTEMADAIIYVRENQEINKYDKIKFDGKTYRVDSVGDRTDKGITVFKPVDLYLIE